MYDRQHWQKVLWCDFDGFRYIGDESSRWNQRCMQARWHSNTQVSNGIEKEFVENVVKSESYLEGEAM